VNDMLLGQNPIFKAQNMFQLLQSNGTLTKEQADMAYKAFVLFSTQPQGVTFSDSFAVYDKSGKEIGNFQSEDEAKKFADKNGGVVELNKNGWVGYTPVKTGGTTDEPVLNIPPPPNPNDPQPLNLLDPPPPPFEKNPTFIENLTGQKNYPVENSNTPIDLGNGTLLINGVVVTPDGQPVVIS